MTSHHPEHIPPRQRKRYLFNLHYSGDRNTGPAIAKHRIRLESERAGLNP